MPLFLNRLHYSKSYIRAPHITSLPFNSIVVQVLAAIKPDLLQANEHIRKVQLQQEGPHHRNAAMYRGESLQILLTAYFYPRFVYFLTLANRLCRIFFM